LDSTCSPSQRRTFSPCYQPSPLPLPTDPGQTMVRQLARWARESTKQGPPLGVWESMWPRAIRDWRLFVKTTWGTLLIGVGIALGGSVGGLLGSASGLVSTATFAALAATAASLAALAIVFITLVILTPARQRDEVRREYVRLLHPRTVPFSERQTRLTQCAAEGRLILARARCASPQDLGTMDALWEDASRWEAATATTIAQITGSTGPFWMPRVSDLPPRLDLFVAHLDRKFAILTDLVDELP
jgi:hypothetical protein